MQKIKTAWLIGRQQIADYCGVHPDTIRKIWMKKFKMPITKINGRWCAIPSSLDEWLNYPNKKEIVRKS